MIRALILASLALAAPAFAAERIIPVGSFDKLSAGNSADVTVRTGSAISVRAIGSDKALDRLDIVVEDGALQIRNKRGVGYGWQAEKVRIAVTVPMLKAIGVGGAGNVQIDRIDTPEFRASVAGSGNVRVDRIATNDFRASVAGSGDLVLPALTAKTASFSVAGAGDVQAIGTAPTVKASVAGSGDLDISGLKAQTVAASVAGAGGVSAFASESATVSVVGAGSVRIAGTSKCSISKRGSGRVTCADSSVR